MAVKNSPVSIIHTTSIKYSSLDYHEDITCLQSGFVIYCYQVYQKVKLTNFWEDLYDEDNYTKKQLLGVMNSKEYEGHNVDHRAKEAGDIVLRLPPYHYVFSLII